MTPSTSIREAIARAIDRAAEKLGSGQWWLCISGAFVFSLLAYTGALTEGTVAGILVMVFKDYFGRDRTKNGNGSTHETDPK